MQRKLFPSHMTTPALMKSLGPNIHTEVTTRTTRITGMLPADSRFTLVRANLWSRNVTRCTPWHHCNFCRLQRAPLSLTLRPRPMAAVIVFRAQPPKVEMRNGPQVIYHYHTCTEGRSQSLADWSHHQGSWHAPCRFQGYIGAVGQLLRLWHLF